MKMRQFTNQEKHIVKKITSSSGIYIDRLFSKVINKCNISCDFEKNEIKVHYLNETSNEFKTPEKVVQEIFVLAKLLQLLESEGLILSFEKTLNKALENPHSIGTSENIEQFSIYHFGDKKLKKIFIKYVATEIYPTEELKSLVKRFFISRGQLYQFLTLMTSWLGKA